MGDKHIGSMAEGKVPFFPLLFPFFCVYVYRCMYLTVYNIHTEQGKINLEIWRRKLKVKKMTEVS